MRSSIVGFFPSSLAIAVLAAPGHCNDWYVDVIHGSDAASGASMATAWKTLTHARATVPIGAAETIHVAPGVYDAASGESFPIDMPPNFRVVGAGAATIFRGAQGDVLFQFESSTTGNGWSLPESTVLESVRLETAALGVRISTVSSRVRPTLRDVQIDTMTGEGVSVSSAGAVAAPIGSCILERTTVRNCAFGLVADTIAPPSAPITVDESTFANNARAWSIHAFRATHVTARRCRFVGNSGWAVQVDGGQLGTALLTMEDCLIASNAGAGVRLQYASPSMGLVAAARAVLRRCTIARNAAGVNLAQPQNGVDLIESIVAENVDDLKFVSSGPIVTVVNSLIEGGDFAGVNGNLSGSPRFVNSAGGDWRLDWTSPCIDALSGAGASGSDLAGNPRTIDGNLDTVEAQDMGAFEFAPLQLASAPSIGSFLALECWGERGGLSTVYFSRRPLASVPQSTPFGEFDLDPAQFGFFKSTATTAGAPALVQRSIPNLISLVGSTFTFQARTTSSIAPGGAAYSNPIAITILP